MDFLRQTLNWVYEVLSDRFLFGGSESNGKFWSCSFLWAWLKLRSWIHTSIVVQLWPHITHVKTEYKQFIFSLQSAPSLFLKSNFEYLRGNYRKAVKLLNSSNIAEHPGFMKTGKRKLRNSSTLFYFWLSVFCCLLYFSSVWFFIIFYFYFITVFYLRPWVWVGEG